MNGQAFIYTLSHPITKEIRYVGVTIRALQVRFIAHMYEVKCGGKSYKCNWIRSLLSNGLRPIIEEIDVVPESEWIFWEKHWIAQCRQWGLKLTNYGEGGEGGAIACGWHHSEETKELIRFKNSGERNYNYGKTLSEEWKKKISESVSGEKNGFFSKKHTRKTMLKQFIPVLQYTLDGIFVREWESMVLATKKTGIKDISMASDGKLHSAGGFQWKRKKGKAYPMKISSARPYRKSVAQIDPQTNEIIHIWNSIRQAQTTLKLSHISKVCLGYKSHKTIGGYKWKFV